MSRVRSVMLRLGALGLLVLACAAPTPGDVGGNQLQTLHIDPNGRFWVGSPDGHAYRFDPATGKFQAIRFPGRDDDRFSDDRIWYFGDGPDGRLWLSTRDELVAIDPGSAAVVERIEGLLPPA